MFRSVEELVKQANEYGAVSEIMIQIEMKTSQESREQFIGKMKQQLRVMEKRLPEVLMVLNHQRS